MSETQGQLDASASLQPSRPGILRSKSNSDMSTTSSESASTITFAPLPSLETRKRRNSRPIGVAGRAEMLRRSMANAHQQYGYEDEQMSPDDDEEIIIPLPDVGKLIKGLWKAVSRMQKNSSSHEVSHPPTVEEGGREEEREGKASVDEATWPSPSDPSSSTTFPKDDRPH